MLVYSGHFGWIFLWYNLNKSPNFFILLMEASLRWNWLPGQGGREAEQLRPGRQTSARCCRGCCAPRWRREPQ